MRKGDWFEAEFSKFMDGVPFLVSSKLLRKFNLGQVDCAQIIKKNSTYGVVLYELKFRAFPSSGQLKRLWKTQDFLARHLDTDVKLEIKFCQKGNDSLF